MLVDEYEGLSEPHKVYRYELGMRILLYGFAGFLFVLGIGLGALELAGVDTNGRRPDMGLIGNGILVFVFVGMGLILVLVTCNTKLILTAEGVEYRTLNYRLSTSWENVQAIGPVGRGNHKSEGLLLREFPTQRHGVLGQLTRISLPEKAIPLVGIGSPRYGPISRDLRQHAPHLFGEDGRPRDST